MRSKQWISDVAGKTVRAGRELGRGILRLSSGPSLTFCDLPEDVLVCILSYCDLRDLLSCTAVSCHCHSNRYRLVSSVTRCAACSEQLFERTPASYGTKPC